MDSAIFVDRRMGLRERFDDLRLASRIALDADAGMLFLDFEGLRVRSEADIDAIRDAVDAILAPLDRRVPINQLWRCAGKP